MSISYKPEVQTGRDPKFYSNNLAFATYAEALYSARDLMNRWMLVVDCRATESDEPVNARINCETGVFTMLPASLVEHEGASCD